MDKGTFKMKKNKWKIELELESKKDRTNEEVEEIIMQQLKSFFENGRVKVK